MSSANELYDALARIECSDFEELVVRYLRETYSDLRGLISTGKNSKNKPIPCPVDAMLYIAGSPPRCVAVAITTEMRKNLSGKWLGNAGKIGDIDKAAKYFETWKTYQPDIVCELYIATNCQLGSEVSLYRKAIERGRAHNIRVTVVEASCLLDFLDRGPEGQYVRQELLGIPASRMSLSLLRSISLQTLDQHWQRFGSARTGIDTLIQREAALEVRHALTGNAGLVGLTGASGVGKSALAQQIARELVSTENIVIWIAAEWIVPDAPLVTTLASTLSKFHSSLNNAAGEDALRIATEQARGITLLIDDINRTGSISALLRTIEGWASRNKGQEGGRAGNNIDILVPLWPNEAIPLNPNGQNDNRTRADWHLISIRAYTDREQRMLEEKQNRGVSSDNEQIFKVLSGDPFLCGLVSPHLEVTSDTSRSELIRVLFENALHLASQKAEENARAAGQMVTANEVGYALDDLIEQMLLADEPEPDWLSVRAILGDRKADILHRLADTNQLGWLASEAERTVWRWKHTRLRDALTGRWLAKRIFLEWESRGTSDATRKWLAHPGLSEAWALALVFAPNSEAQVRLIYEIGMSFPLALASALRLNLFPAEQAQRAAIQQALKTALSILGDRENEFVSGLETLILAQLAETNDPLVIVLTEDLSITWDVRFARIRNGDLQAALQYFDSQLRRGEFPPSYNFRTLEDSLEALTRLYTKNEETLAKQLSSRLHLDSEPEPAILLMGYLGWSQFCEVICKSWEARRAAEDTRPGSLAWQCYLWSLARCCSEEGISTLAELLRGVEMLSKDRGETGGEERYLHFSMPLRAVGRSRLPLSSIAAATWAKVATDHSNISYELFYTARRVESPIFVEAYVRWYVKAKPFMHEFSRNSDVLKDPQPLPRDTHLDVAVFRSSVVLDRLWELATNDGDANVRELAFQMWRRSASITELPQLQSIPEASSLFNAALEVRARLGDETAGGSLAKKIKEKPTDWCAYAPRLYQVPEVKEAFLDNYAAALEGDGYEEGYAPSHLPAEAVPEFIERLRPVLLKTRRTWTSLFLTGVPEALTLIQEVIAGAQESDLEHLFSYRLYGGGPITRRMLDALRPVLHRLRENDIRRLVEQALKDGQGEWVMQNLTAYVSAPDHPRYWLNEQDILDDLNALAAQVLHGTRAVYATHYYHEVISSDAHSPYMTDFKRTLRRWLGATPTDAQITIAALALIERGQTEDIAWWQDIRPQQDTCRQQWENTFRILLIRKWKG